MRRDAESERAMECGIGGSMMPDAAWPDPAAFRAQVRAGHFTGRTAGIAPGFQQANVTILPAALAAEFRLFCLRNPAALPLLDITAPGSPHPLRAAPDADLATDIPLYRCFDGPGPASESQRIDWGADHVGVLTGCALTADLALGDAGFRFPHMEPGGASGLYVTTRPCIPAGRISGPLVVIMRPVRRDQIDAVVRVTAGLPQAHGAPVAIGDPAALGLHDLGRPDWGRFNPVPEDALPVFWACGVTAQVALQRAGLFPFVTHAPGHLFVTDLPADAPPLQERDRP